MKPIQSAAESQANANQSQPPEEAEQQRRDSMPRVLELYAADLERNHHVPMDHGFPSTLRFVAKMLRERPYAVAEFRNIIDDCKCVETHPGDAVRVTERCKAYALAGLQALGAEL